MNTLLNTDFESESEDENFNPAPAVNSDDEGGPGSDAEDNRVKASSNNGHLTNGHNTLDVDGDEDGLNDTVDGAQEDDEDEEDEDEDDEDAVTVSLAVNDEGWTRSNRIIREDHVNVLGEILVANSSISRPRLTTKMMPMRTMRRTRPALLRRLILTTLRIYQPVRKQMIGVIESWIVNESERCRWMPKNKRNY